jgi:hypothetical protein
LPGEIAASNNRIEAELLNLNLAIYLYPAGSGPASYHAGLPAGRECFDIARPRHFRQVPTTLYYVLFK